MKIFFGVSLRALPKYKEEFLRIYNLIDKLGHENLNDLPIQSNPHDFYSKNESELKEIHKILSRKIRQADIIIIEATIHSLTMGFYIKMALDLDKPVIILYKSGNRPYYFSAIENEKLQLVEYTLESIEDVLHFAIDYAKEMLDIRFNLFFSSELNEYLKWASAKLEMPRSNFVRNLLIEHKKMHIEEYEKDFQK